MREERIDHSEIEVLERSRDCRDEDGGRTHGIEPISLNARERFVRFGRYGKRGRIELK